MRNWTYSHFMRVFAFIAVSVLGIAPLAAQAPAARAPARPNLNGIWQAMNSANYNLDRKSVV